MTNDPSEVLLGELMRLRRKHLDDTLRKATPYCIRCGTPHSKDFNCLRDEERRKALGDYYAQEGFLPDAES